MTNPSVLELEPVPVPCVILAMAASINREGRPLHLLNFWAFVATSWNKPILLPTDRALRPKTVHGCKRRHARACINVASQRFAAAIWNVPPKGFVIRGGEGRTGRALCFAFRELSTAMFRRNRAITRSMPISRHYLHLRRRQ
jgi:hypothetical protein